MWGNLSYIYLSTSGEAYATHHIPHTTHQRAETGVATLRRILITVDMAHATCTRYPSATSAVSSLYATALSIAYARPKTRHRVDKPVWPP